MYLLLYIIVSCGILDAIQRQIEVKEGQKYLFMFSPQKLARPCEKKMFIFLSNQALKWTNYFALMLIVCSIYFARTQSWESLFMMLNVSDVALIDQWPMTK